jgi:hypothetical protein
MRCPSGVCNPGVRIEDLGQIQVRLRNEVLQLRHLPNLFKRKNLILGVAINREPRRVISTCFAVSIPLGSDASPPVRYSSLERPLTKVFRM